MASERQDGFASLAVVARRWVRRACTVAFLVLVPCTSGVVPAASEVGRGVTFQRVVDDYRPEVEAGPASRRSRPAIGKARGRFPWSVAVPANSGPADEVDPRAASQQEDHDHQEVLARLRLKKSGQRYWVRVPTLEPDEDGTVRLEELLGGGSFYDFYDDRGTRLPGGMDALGNYVQNSQVIFYHYSTPVPQLRAAAQQEEKEEHLHLADAVRLKDTKATPALACGCGSSRMFTKRKQRLRAFQAGESSAYAAGKQKPKGLLSSTTPAPCSTTTTVDTTTDTTANLSGARVPQPAPAVVDAFGVPVTYLNLMCDLVHEDKHPGERGQMKARAVEVVEQHPEEDASIEMVGSLSSHSSTTSWDCVGDANSKAEPRIRDHDARMVPSPPANPLLYADADCDEKIGNVAFLLPDHSSPSAQPEGRATSSLGYAVTDAQVDAELGREMEKLIQELQRMHAARSGMNMKKPTDHDEAKEQPRKTSRALVLDAVRDRADIYTAEDLLLHSLPFAECTRDYVVMSALVKKAPRLVAYAHASLLEATDLLDWALASNPKLLCSPEASGLHELVRRSLQNVAPTVLQRLDVAGEGRGDVEYGAQTQSADEEVLAAPKCSICPASYVEQELPPPRHGTGARRSRSSFLAGGAGTTSARRIRNNSPSGRTLEGRVGGNLGDNLMEVAHAVVRGTTKHAGASAAA